MRPVTITPSTSVTDRQDWFRRGADRPGAVLRWVAVQRGAVVQRDAAASPGSVPAGDAGLCGRSHGGRLHGLRPTHRRLGRHRSDGGVERVHHLGVRAASTRTSTLLALDVAVTAACLVSSRWIVGPDQLSHGMPTLTITWMACPVLAVAVARGRRWSTPRRWRWVHATSPCGPNSTRRRSRGRSSWCWRRSPWAMSPRLAADMQQRLQQAAELEAATRERERLARGIHDSVLQVLALVQRRGAGLRR